MDLKREELKGQVGTVPGSPSPGQENQTVPGRRGQSKSAPTETAKPEGADRGGHNRTLPASADRGRHNRTLPASADRAEKTGPCQPAPIGAEKTGPCQPAPIGADTTGPCQPAPIGAEKPDPASQPRQDCKPDFDTLMTPPAAPAPIARPLPVGMIVPLVIVAALLLALLPLLLHVRHRRRSGSSSFSAGRAGPSAWAGPVSLPEERGEGQAGDGGQQAGPGEARRPTLTTFFGKRHSRVSSVAMEDVAGVKGEGPLSEPLLATGGQGSEPGPQGAGEANGTVPLTPGPPSPPPDPPANGEFPLPPPHGAGSHAPCVSPTPNRLPRPRRPPCWNSQELPHSQHPAPSPQRPLLGEAGAGIAGSSRTASTLPPPHSAPCWARPGLE
ncbi:leukosialin [Lepidochelys kempii]|uniref:leukosialin n=1 Tax=Lepidochelys kempii TaxID=8472 RepID=UPI003C6F5BC7